MFDAIVIGSGFGGAVAAARLVEAGYKVCLLERGRRYEEGDFPELPSAERAVPDFARYNYNSASGELGLWDIRWLGDSLAVQAAGYGGGSLVYAGVHLRAPAEVLNAWPAELSREQLDPYYDLAAFMLQVAPMPVGQRPLRAKRMEQTAANLGRSADFFYPPLAITFGEGSVRSSEKRGKLKVADPDAGLKNRFGRMQKPCRHCGECLNGCKHSAKNTLPYNYLAHLENPKQPQDGEPPDIRTLAEATSIRPLVDKDGKPAYTVHYWDHVVNKVGDAPTENTVMGRAVFVCAGAVGSTELLLKSRDHLPGLSQKLGQDYFSNADALAAVFDAKDALDATDGPTITSTLLYRRTEAELVGSNAPSSNAAKAFRAKVAGAVRANRMSASKGQLAPTAAGGAAAGSDGAAGAGAVGGAGAEPVWFMLQDGGFPDGLEQLIAGVARSPLWLARNRHRDSVEISPAPLEKLPKGREPWRAPSLLEGSLLALEEGALNGAIPPGLKQAIEQVGRELSAKGNQELGEIVGGVRKLLVEQAEQQVLSGLWPVVRERPLVQAAVRAMVNWLFDKFASQATIAKASAETLQQRYPIEKPGELLRRALRWAAGQRGAEPGLRRHDLVLLAMGRDDHPGRLLLVPKSCQVALTNPSECCRVSGSPPCALAKQGAAEDWALQSDLSLTNHAVVYSAQERLLRDVAKDWGAELRFNPIWSFVRRPLSVHNQGGCAMTAEPTVVNSGEGRGLHTYGVLTPDGEVRGHANLFVLDAAAFPTSVGVNPSATILALAERNIERFIRKTRKVPAHETWQASHTAAAKEWCDARRHLLDPAPLQRASETDQSPATKAKSIGILFKEQMSGFYAAPLGALDAGQAAAGHGASGPGAAGASAAGPSAVGPCGGKALAAWPGTALPQNKGLYERAENRGRAANPGSPTPQGGNWFDLKIRVCARDLQAFLEDREHTLQVMGKVNLRGALAPLTGKVTGTLNLFPLHQQTQLRTLVYKLEFCASAHDRAKRWTMVGTKFVSNDPGPDLWSDTSRLYVDVYDPAGNHAAMGIIHVSLEGFMFKQLKSYRVFGSKDPAQVAWAVASFSSCFFGNLMDAYAPQLPYARALMADALRIGSPHRSTDALIPLAQLARRRS